MRNKLSKDNRKIDLIDLGAGSKVEASNTKSVKAILKSASSGTAKTKFLFKLINWMKPTRVLELGTNLGISALTMHKASKNTHIETIEGCPNTLNIARELLGKIPNIQSIHSDFDNYFNSIQGKEVMFDCIFIDGNHAYDPTMRYTNIVQDKLRPTSMVIYDDIYWSTGMTKAWKEIKRKKIYDATIDLFQFGIGIHNPSMEEKQNFVVIPKKYKPWKLGFFG